MKLAIFAVFLALFLATALAQTSPQKAVMVTYKQDTPDSVLEQAKEAIRQAGGIITHEFSKTLIRSRRFSELTLSRIAQGIRRQCAS